MSDLLECPVCGEIWDWQAIVNQADISGKAVMDVYDVFEITGCRALAVPHLRPPLD